MVMFIAVLLMVALCAWVLVGLAVGLVATSAVHEMAVLLSWLGATVALAGAGVMVALWRVVLLLDRLADQRRDGSAQP